MNNMNGWTPGIDLEQWEKLAIEAAFHFYRGHKAQTAIALGISVRTLDSKLEKYDFDRGQARDRYERDKIENARILERLRGKHNDPAQAVENGTSSLYRADTGVHMEPPTFTGKEPTVSLPQREEIQAVLPIEPADSRSRGRRQAISNTNGKK